MNRTSNPKGQVPTHQTASKTGAGEVVAAVTGDTIVITDILASAATTISTLATGGGTVLAYMPVGASNFTSGIPVATSAGVFSSAGNVTINYYVK
jgi:hypothetical protein|tara:strand:+ start:220 stop:504 length:285 start_codon:yes stop_codon:yes gene_type:complete